MSKLEERTEYLVLDWDGSPFEVCWKPGILHHHLYHPSFHNSHPSVSIGDWFQDPLWIPKFKDAQVP